MTVCKNCEKLRNAIRQQNEVIAGMVKTQKASDVLIETFSSNLFSGKRKESDK